MPLRRLHVVKCPTTQQNLFPYSHYKDPGHNPLIGVTREDDHLVLVCTDTFKLKPNVQVSPRLRVDIYMPGSSALEIGSDVLSMFGVGDIAELASVDPEDFRVGPQSLPRIREGRRVSHIHTKMTIAGYRIEGGPGPMYVDQEEPAEGHIEMQGPEVHIGIPLHQISGDLDQSAIRYVNVSLSELRVKGERNPVKKASGTLKVTLGAEQARNLAATLIYYARQ